MTDPTTPPQLKYTADHEWVKEVGEHTVRVGVTDYAQQQLGDVVFVQLPESGASVTAGDSFGEVESTKSVSDVFAPIGGAVGATNDALEGSPELVNSDPYGAGWLVEIEVEGDIASLLESAMDAEAYREFVSSN